MTKRNMVRYRYSSHRRNAKKVGTPFLLTFEEWSDIWMSSGCWDQRGKKGDQYCMARFQDQGAYKVGNVKIVTNKENRGERKHSLKERAQLSAMMSKVWASTKERVRRSKIISTVATGRRLVTRNGKRAWARPGDPDYPGA